MRLQHATWYEVDAYLASNSGIVIPTGSTEQHGPIGLIGTDALCAENIAIAAADRTQMLIAPTLAYTPAPFNMAFAGSMSVTPKLFQETAEQLIAGLLSQGFTRIFFLNGHGANLAPLHAAADKRPEIQIRSWWDFPKTNALRQKYYGDWEGMHATPSEVALTRAFARTVEHQDAIEPPQKLTSNFIKAHAGDKHGAPADHRRDFPDGRVGSHSALATKAHGQTLLKTAATECAEAFAAFTRS